MVLLMIAGVGAILAGAVAIWFGIPVKEFSFGNTMILAGTIAICSGLILMGIGLVVRELKLIRRRLQSDDLGLTAQETDGPPLPAGSITGGNAGSDDDRFERRHVSLDHGSLDNGKAPPLEPSGSRRGAATESELSHAHDAPDVESASVPETPPAKPRRNLLFSSSRRERERERAAVPIAPPASDAPLEPDVPQSDSGASSSPHPSFKHTWPRTERVTRTDVAASRRDAASSPAGHDSTSMGEARSPAETIVKSGVVDGMAYSLYADGSIEAQMPEGMIRFASIEELRVHLDRAR